MSWQTKLPLIAILRGIRPDEVETHIVALLNAGFDAIEIPLNSPDWQQSIELAARLFGDRALIGAGTVLHAQQVNRLAEINCRLIVTPSVNIDVIKQAVRHGMTTCIGCATATEAFAAVDAGCGALKIFPSAIFGPAYIKALRAVLPPELPVFAVGGVTPQNLADYLRAGCVGAGLGSDLYQAGQSAAITAARAKEFISAYQSYLKGAV